MVNSGKYCILPEIVFSKSNTKGGDKEYILCNSMLLTECLHILYGELTGLTMIHLCGWSCSALVWIEVDASARIFKNGFIVVLCILISITCQSTGSVNLKAEKLFIKQHVRTNQSFPVHSIYNLRLIG